MNIGFIVASDLIATSVHDTADTFDNTVRQSYATGLELEHDGSIYINETGAKIVIDVFDNGVAYANDDLAWHDTAPGYLLKKYVETTGDDVPAQPSQYAAYDDSNDASTWASRYNRIMSYADYQQNGLVFTETDGTYSYVHAMTWVSGFNGNGYLFYKCTKTRLSDGGVEATLGASVNLIDDGVDEDSVEASALVEDDYMWAARTVIIDDTGVYVRTNVSASVEYVSPPATAEWQTVTTPADIGFVYSRIPLQYSPFDKKQYTSVVNVGDQQYTVRALLEFNAVVVSRLRGHAIIVKFFAPDGSTVETVTKNIDNTIDAHIEPAPTTDVVYCSQWIGAGGSVEVVVVSNGLETEVGSLFPVASIYVGPTRMKMKHKAENNDRTSVSEISGFKDIIEGTRYLIYTGSFIVNMMEYSKLVKLMKKMTNWRVVLDGSDMDNNANADEINTFASTKILGRVDISEIETEIEHNRMVEYVNVPFTIEEDI